MSYVSLLSSLDKVGTLRSRNIKWVIVVWNVTITCGYLIFPDLNVQLSATKTCDINMIHDTTNRQRQLGHCLFMNTVYPNRERYFIQMVI